MIQNIAMTTRTILQPLETSTTKIKVYKAKMLNNKQIIVVIAFAFMRLFKIKRLLPFRFVSLVVIIHQLAIFVYSITKIYYRNSKFLLSFSQKIGFSSFPFYKLISAFLTKIPVCTMHKRGFICKNIYSTNLLRSP